MAAEIGIIGKRSIWLHLLERSMTFLSKSIDEKVVIAKSLRKGEPS